ncbi:uncharacterized protein V1518DRAFT_417628 [Limtongia smithiae]|uniref:uncharacterized protein n=1 Tax=Limtongia smithiae TaxID=1125753 RepID=UPI0034CDE3E8
MMSSTRRRSSAIDFLWSNTFLSLGQDVEHRNLADYPGAVSIPPDIFAERRLSELFLTNFRPSFSDVPGVSGLNPAHPAAGASAMMPDYHAMGIEQQYDQTAGVAIGMLPDYFYAETLMPPDAVPADIHESTDAHSSLYSSPAEFNRQQRHKWATYSLDEPRQQPEPVPVTYTIDTTQHYREEPGSDRSQYTHMPAPTDPRSVPPHGALLEGCNSYEDSDYHGSESSRDHSVSDGESDRGVNADDDDLDDDDLEDDDDDDEDLDDDNDDDPTYNPDSRRQAVVAIPRKMSVKQNIIDSFGMFSVGEPMSSSYSEPVSYYDNGYSVAASDMNYIGCNAQSAPEMQYTHLMSNSNAAPSRLRELPKGNQELPRNSEHTKDIMTMLNAKMTRTKKGLFRCSHCTNKFATMDLFNQHINMENLDRPFKCTEATCPWSLVGFPNRNECSRHIKHQHDPAKYSCSYSWCCNKAFPRKDSRNRHEKLVHEKPGSRLNKKLEKQRIEQELRQRKREERRARAASKRGSSRRGQRELKTATVATVL